MGGAEMGKIVVAFLVCLAAGVVLAVGPSLALAVQAIQTTIKVIGG
jgi:hypothetical protein